MDIATFRAAFPEFSDTTVYPDAQVTFWLNLAVLLVNATRFGALTDYAISLFIAHNLALERAAAAGGAGGGAPGLTMGAMTGKTIGKVSASYDVSVGLVADGGNWNLTTYGTRFLWLMNLGGMGPAQFGIGCDPGYFMTGPGGVQGYFP